MKDLSIFLLLLFLSVLGEVKTGQAQNTDVYIVYMGDTASKNTTLRDDHAQLLTYLSKRKRNALVHIYRHGFSGFAARLSEEEASSIAMRPGVVSVFRDTVLKLHTTRSWDFLENQNDLTIDPGRGSDSVSSSSQEYDTIIGILDTGIWPESQSFSDEGMGPVPSRWKGTCKAGPDFSSSLCNRKLIGARSYINPDTGDTEGTPRDVVGHGTHVASTAAGASVAGASYYGLASGTAKGGAPPARIAVYRVCSSEGCMGSAILAAFDDAIADGVDVLSLSIGASSQSALDLSSDPITIGAFHAVEKGITVVCSAGNEGPQTKTVVNTAPWILTVGATTIDRDFESNVQLGNNKVIKGRAIHFGDLKNSPVYPLIHGMDAKAENDVPDQDARNCNPVTLNGAKVKGKIVVCEIDDDYYTDDDKVEEVMGQGGIGAILLHNHATAVASTYRSFPVSIIPSNASDLLAYLNSTSNPVGTILPTVSVIKQKPAPVVAYFSSRGPSSSGSTRILKPDVVAPGANILAAWPGNDTSEALEGKDPPLFYVLSGTSMSCPHVSGIAATVKSQFPAWTPSAIKSAIMTTASQTNNLKAPITNDESGLVATPFDYGAGLVTTAGPLQPGLIYETSTIDFLLFLCDFGYNTSEIKLISAEIPDGFSCPPNPSADLISNMNYPSISIYNFDGKASKNVTRTVTNVGSDDETIYTATMEIPAGLEVKVVPEKLQFTKNTKKLSYQVIFTPAASSSNADYLFGSLTWTNGKYKVRTPFVVSAKN